MTDNWTAREYRDAAGYAGEMASQRLHDLIQERFEELKARGISQSDIAARLGLSPQRVGFWMSEPRNMTIKSVGRLLAALDAYLLFELDRLEVIQACNAPPAQEVAVRPTITVSHPSQRVYLAPSSGFTLRKSSLPALEEA